MTEGQVEKTIKGLANMLTVLQEQNEKLQEKVHRLENAVVILNADLTNTKQLVAHTMGRGMGSTVHNKEG